MEITQAEYYALIAVALAARELLAELGEAQAHGECGECPPTVATAERLRATLGMLNWVDVTPFGATRREFMLGEFPPAD